MSEEADKAVNDFLKSSGFGDLKVSGVGNTSDRVERVEITLKRNIDQALLQRAMKASDEATTVLLWALEIEYQLSLFLAELIGQKIRDSNNLNSLVLMLRACRFETDIVQVVDGFRRLRNKFAHEKDASLEKHSDITDGIFACKVPTLMEQILDTVSDGKSPRKVSDLPTLERLAIYAECTVLFLAGASQVYSFPKPTKRIVLTSSGAAP